MDTSMDLRRQALAYHRRLPPRLWQYLNSRGIPDVLIHRHLLGWNGQRITIPISDHERKFVFFKLAKDPEDRTDSPKMLATAGAKAELYGWEAVVSQPGQLIICEGEFDRLVLEGQGFAAATSTGGALTFRPEWAEAIREIPHVYLSFDNDAAGQAGAERVARLIPQARIVRLPEDVGQSGDVTDFFVRLGRSRDDFLALLETAQPLPEEKRAAALGPPRTSPTGRCGSELELLKSEIPIERFISRYFDLRQSSEHFLGRCPFHRDHHPSFVVYPRSQSFYCFGCQASGDVISFLMRVESLTFREALQVLQETYG